MSPARRTAPALREQVVVVGGGISGLATAALLARDGHEVTIVEARDQLGGRAGDLEIDGFRFDAGPSWYLMPEVFDHFFRMLGTSAAEQLDLELLDPGYRVVFEREGDGPTERVDIAARREQNVAILEGLEAGAGRKLERYLDSAAWVYETAKRSFLYTTFADVRPVLKSKGVVAGLPKLLPMLLGSLDRFVSARFQDHRIRQILGYPAVFLGASPYATPGMYHLMSHLDLDDGVLYPAGGITRVIEAIADLTREQGVRILTGTRATQVRTVTRGGGRPGVTGVEIEDADGRRVLPASRVVFAMDLHAAETGLLPEALQSYPQSWWDRRTPGPGAVLVYLGVRGELPELLHHTLFFTRDWETNFGAIFPRRGQTPPAMPDELSVYVCRPSATDDTVAPEGHENLFVLVPVPADPGIGGSGSPEVERIADATIAQLASWTGVPDLADRIVVRRTVGPADFQRDLGAWRGTSLGPAHTLAQSAMFRGRNVSDKVAGLSYAGGSTIPGIGLPMCLISAELVLKRFRGDTSAGPSPEPTARAADRR